MDKMTSCSNPNRDRKNYTLGEGGNNYALLYDVNSWNSGINGDPNFDEHGSFSGFPPPDASGDLQKLFGNTQCDNKFGGEFNCNVGVLGLYSHEDVNTFRTTYDQATKGQSLSAMDPATGEILIDTENDNICKKAYDKDLTIDFGKYDNLLDAPITAMHKNWGSVRKKVTVNGGVHVNNVALSDKPISGIYKDGNGKTININQKCLALTLRGSEYNDCNDGNCTYGLTTKKKDGKTEYISTQSGFIPDVHAECPGNTYGTPDCQLNRGQKVGACIATEYMLGPGYYEVIAHAPDITQFNMKDGVNKSNGYCWAIWTFHYEEHYGCNESESACNDKYANPNSQFIDDNTNNKGNVSDGYCYNEGLVLETGTNIECFTDPMTDKNNIKFSSASDGNNDKDLYLPGKDDIFFPSALPLKGPRPVHKTCYGDVHDYGYDPNKCSVDTSTGVVNHEIDIEIPGSWPGKKKDDANSKYWTPSTWNCNTFIGSNNPALVRGSWSSQYVIQKMTEDNKAILNGEPNSFLATPPKDLKNPENDENLEFHKYAFNWCVPGDGGGPYVEWFFDDKPIFKSYTQVPTRSSRLVVGGWFPHWTQDGNSDCKPEARDEILSAPFDTAKILVASIVYKPNCYDPVMNKTPPDGTSSNVTVDFPQNYDQCGKGGENPIALGFTPPNLPGTQLANGQVAQDDNRVCNENCPTTKPSPSPSKSPLMTIVIVLIVLVVLAFLGLGVYMFINRKKSKE